MLDMNTMQALFNRGVISPNTLQMAQRPVVQAQPIMRPIVQAQPVGLRPVVQGQPIMRPIVQAQPVAQRPLTVAQPIAPRPVVQPNALTPAIHVQPAPAPALTPVRPIMPTPNPNAGLSSNQILQRAGLPSVSGDGPINLQQLRALNPGMFPQTPAAPVQPPQQPLLQPAPVPRGPGASANAINPPVSSGNNVMMPAQPAAPTPNRTPMTYGGGGGNGNLAQMMMYSSDERAKKNITNASQAVQSWLDALSKLNPVTRNV